MEFIVADVVIFAISVLGLVLAVEMVDAINKNRNGLLYISDSADELPCINSAANLIII